MNIKFFCPVWGSGHLDFRSFLDKVKMSGYDGVEISLPLIQQEKEDILMMLEEYDLLMIAQHWETATPDYELHKSEYSLRLENLAQAGPLFINSQTGKDYFTFEQNRGLIDIARQLAERYGVKIIHETHRGKFSFAAHVTSDYLNKLPGLRLGLDISHWCAVAESWLDDQEEALELAFSRTDHIHARIGFPEGPQVTDPRIPEWRAALEKHAGWWNKVLEKKKMDGLEEFTITPEFGPYPYMINFPATGEPIASQWDINLFIKDYLKSVLTY